MAPCWYTHQGRVRYSTGQSRKPPAGFRACWMPVGDQAHGASWAAPLPDASGATVMGTLLASQACTARRNLVHFCPDDLGSPCPWDAHSPVCAIPPRTYACGALLFLRLCHPSFSLPVALVLRGHRVRAC